MTDPRFPIGDFNWPSEVTAGDRAKYIQTIADAPAMYRQAVAGLSDAQLDTPYREGGWTLRQVVHHVPESHMNAYVRFKLALTEAEPVIKPYDEAAWANLSDVGVTPVETSLTLLDMLHQRWVILMQCMAEPDWKKIFRHPERGVVSLENNLAMYAWHCRHHLAHITSVART
jgi:hypothetical protein